MSLKFLSKKSWNTTNIKNVEKVWIAEQNAEKEKKKLAELQKQINEERQIRELRELQVASGQAVKTVDTSLDWMYEGPAAQQAQTSEEYLLGKIYKPQDAAPDADVQKLVKDPGALWLNKTSVKNDVFTRLHEDPMLSIKMSEKKALENVLNNPVKMARIKHQLSSEIAKSEEKKRHKKEHKKERKKESKKHKHRSRSNSSDSRRPSSPKSKHRDPSPRRQRSRSPDRKYGLQGDVARRSDATYLGPRPDILEKRKQQSEAEMAAKKRPRADVKSLSEEEKRRRLEEMTSDALRNDEMRFQRQLQSRRHSNAPEDEGNNRGASFISDMRSEVYNKHDGNMEERLSRNRHYHQRGEDLESTGLTKR